jgi:KDO2-lipid IV(A) lauroyltransferase
VTEPDSAHARRRGLEETLRLLPLLALREALRHLSPERALRVGASLGRSAAELGGHRSAVARVNLRIAFPEWSEAEREQVRRRSYEHLGMGIAELALLQGRSRDAVLDRVEVEGLEHLEAAEAASPTRGVLVITAHFGSWDLCAAAIARRGYALSVVHRGFENPALERMLHEVRQRPGEQSDLEQLRIGRSGISVLRALRAGRKVVVLLDQNARREEGIFVPFFSRPACTRVGPALIAMRGGYPVLPVFAYRIGAGAGHRVRVEAPLVMAPTDLAANVARMTEAVERAIRESPEQWLWLHRRWRTRPAESGDEEPIYASRRGLLRRIRHFSRRIVG